MSEHQNRSARDDVDPAEALGGAGALPLPDGQPRGMVPSDREAPGREAPPEESEDESRPADG